MVLEPHRKRSPRAAPKAALGVETAVSALVVQLRCAGTICPARTCELVWLGAYSSQEEAANFQKAPEGQHQMGRRLVEAPSRTPESAGRGSGEDSAANAAIHDA